MFIKLENSAEYDFTSLAATKTQDLPIGQPIAADSWAGHTLVVRVDELDITTANDAITVRVVGVWPEFDAEGRVSSASYTASDLSSVTINNGSASGLELERTGATAAAAPFVQVFVRGYRDSGTATISSTLGIGIVPDLNT